MQGLSFERKNVCRSCLHVQGEKTTSITVVGGYIYTTKDPIG